MSTREQIICAAFASLNCSLSDARRSLYIIIGGLDVGGLQGKTKEESRAVDQAVFARQCLEDLQDAVDNTRTFFDGN
jgi:hypothetical protein